MSAIAPDIVKKLQDYDNLTDEQRAAVQNGCGGKGGSFRPLHWFDLQPICNRHDYLYSVGTSWDDRLEADNYLLTAILGLGAHMRWYNPKKWYYNFQAHVYYNAVRMFGAEFFGANK